MKAIKNMGKAFLMSVVLSASVSAPVAQASLSGAANMVKKSAYIAAYAVGAAFGCVFLVAAYDWISGKRRITLQRKAQDRAVRGLMIRILMGQGTVSLREFRRHLSALPLRAKNECTRQFLAFRERPDLGARDRLCFYFRTEIENINPESASAKDRYQDDMYSAREWQD